MTSPMTKIAMMALGFFMSLNATAKTIRIDSISDLRTLSYKQSDKIELNADIDLELNESDLSELSEIARDLVDFLSDKNFDRFVIDSKTDAYYYRLMVNHKVGHLSILQRLGPSIRTKVSALLVSHGAI